MAEDNEDFSALMQKSGVKPLAKRAQKAVVAPSPPTLRELAKRRKALQTVHERADEETLVHERGIEWVGAHDVIEYKHTGIQNSVFKNLRHGAFSKEAVLDLHGCRVEEARQVLLDFIHDCGAQSLCYAIIIHGKGHHARAKGEEETAEHTVARLKSHVVFWLKAHPKVLAFSSAQAKDGGTGALYVLMRKMPKITLRE